MSVQRYEAGVLRQFWNDETRTYSEYDEHGVLLREEDYTPEQNAEADARAAGALLEANKSSLQTNLEADVVWLQTWIGKQNSTFNTDFANNPAQFFKPLMKAIRRSSKLLLGDFSSGD